MHAHPQRTTADRSGFTAIDRPRRDAAGGGMSAIELAQVTLR